MAISTISPLTPARQSKIDRFRKILLILLSSLFAFDLFYLIFIVHAYIDHVWFSYYFQDNYELIWTLFSVLHDAFGLIVVCQSSRTGLRLFTWVGTMVLVLILFFVSGFFLFLLLNPKLIQTNNTNLLGHVIFLITFVVSDIFLLIIIALAHKLLKLTSTQRIRTMRSL